MSGRGSWDRMTDNLDQMLMGRGGRRRLEDAFEGSPLFQS